MTRYLDLAEYLWLAEQVIGVDAATLAKASRIDLADSALHAPAAVFGGNPRQGSRLEPESGSSATPIVE